MTEVLDAEDKPKTRGFFWSHTSKELDELEEKFPKLSLLELDESIELDDDEDELLELDELLSDVELSDVEVYNSLDEEDDESIELELELDERL